MELNEAAQKLPCPLKLPPTVSFNAFAALKAGALRAAIWIGSPVAGFLPVLAGLSLTMSLPIPGFIIVSRL